MKNINCFINSSGELKSKEKYANDFDHCITKRLLQKYKTHKGDIPIQLASKIYKQNKAI
tara:strand:- start:261 stop:437 length:177 start_codon:yes stop_codon:yes gene_type:complete